MISDVPWTHHFILRYGGPDCFLDFAHSLLGNPVSFGLLLSRKLGGLLVEVYLPASQSFQAGVQVLGSRFEPDLVQFLCKLA
jgi:hypothetical protein